mgnify:CR=1 FL=1
MSQQELMEAEDTIKYKDLKDNYPDLFWRVILSAEKIGVRYKLSIEVMTGIERSMMLLVIDTLRRPQNEPART